jgi:hypothetical protein
MLDLYKKYPYETSILDDFTFYEKKQENVMNKNTDEQEYMDKNSYLGGVILGNENLNNYNTNIGLNNNKMMNSEKQALQNEMKTIMNNQKSDSLKYNMDMMANSVGNSQGFYKQMPGEMNMISQNDFANLDLMAQMHTPNLHLSQPNFNNLKMNQGFNPQMLNPMQKNSFKKLKRVNSTDNVTKNTY